MIPNSSPTAILNKVARSLVATERFDSVEHALWEMALSAIRGKTSYYRRRIRGLENKYGLDFDQFTLLLKNNADPAREDDWLAWRSAQNMLVDWQQSYQDLLHARPH